MKIPSAGDATVGLNDRSHYRRAVLRRNAARITVALSQRQG
jgi:hypothetical protein